MENLVSFRLHLGAPPFAILASMHQKPVRPVVPEWIEDPPNRLLRWLLGPVSGCMVGAVAGFILGLIQGVVPLLFVGGSLAAFLVLTTGFGALVGTAIGAVAGVLVNVSIWIVRWVAPRHEMRLPNE